MREVTATGQSVNDAVESALTQLHATRDQVEIEILDEGKKGLFGLFGNRSSVVKVSLVDNPIEETRNFLLNVATKMGIVIEITVTERDREVEYQLSGKDIALLIGKRGQTLNSLQYLAQLVFNRHTKQFRTIIVDAENYRSRRKDTLEQLAIKLADKAIKTRKDVALEPMPSYERKIIHTVLVKNRNVKTFSAGEEPFRHLVISPLKKEQVANARV
ncbi:RNA-binding cell elongation regulator Jag/EloR [Bacillus salitolerans]|uniref:RNA-binding protein KhpB n=1 Tax=Bacillus salitolerans TaxID=1437434 RepID=A0ABW4LJT2_9BACI